ncbi:MAG: ribosome rescue GTPase HflX [Pseudomonadota bacterium]|nr:ribosome rescue GTPase HflX [Pseudomonadota bacterium]
MFDRPQSGERAVLVHIEFPQESECEDLQEFEMLVDSAGARRLGVLTGSRASPNPRFFIGKGKVEELAELVRRFEADLVIFNHGLSPSQERNLERELKCRVLDRTGLILDIFAQRARTHEGKLQVELAQLEHLSTRLVRGWTHLERQKGGIGLRGPGETQLETDRRLLRVRVKHIQQRLQKVRRQRDQGRRARRRNDVPTVSLVGYTNAGKSTLFNHLTESGVYAADQLFATLDPTLRRIEVPDLGPLILADTVGFIRHLPHKLVEAFRATLEESRQSDLLLHVVDVCSPEREDNIFQVNEVLHEIGADKVPQLRVYNKIDLLGERQPRIDRDETGLPVAVWLSARTGAGTDQLLQALNERLGRRMVEGTLHLTPDLSAVRAHCYGLQAVQGEATDETGNLALQVRMPVKAWEQLQKRFALAPERLEQS